MNSEYYNNIRKELYNFYKEQSKKETLTEQQEIRLDETVQAYKKYIDNIQKIINFDFHIVVKNDIIYPNVSFNNSINLYSYNLDKKNNINTIKIRNAYDSETVMTSNVNNYDFINKKYDFSFKFSGISGKHIQYIAKIEKYIMNEANLILKPYLGDIHNSLLYISKFYDLINDMTTNKHFDFSIILSGLHNVGINSPELLISKAEDISDLLKLNYEYDISKKLEDLKSCKKISADKLKI